MTNKKQVIYHESARQKKDNTPEWRRVNWARFHTMIPILDALENQNIPEDIQNALRNYLVISLVSTIEFYFKSIAIKNIDKWNMNISDIVNKEITVPFSAFDQIKAGDTTKGTQIARRFSFAKLDDIDDFFSKALKIQCLERIKEFDRLDPSNYFHYAASLNRNWKSFTEMFELRNKVVHDKKQVTLTTNQLRSLCNCTMNLLDHAQIVCSGEFNEGFSNDFMKRLGWLRQREEQRQQRRQRREQVQKHRQHHH